jgi:hypothetical protein
MISEASKDRSSELACVGARFLDGSFHLAPSPFTGPCVFPSHGGCKVQSRLQSAAPVLFHLPSGAPQLAKASPLPSSWQGAAALFSINRSLECRV